MKSEYARRADSPCVRARSSEVAAGQLSFSAPPPHSCGCSKLEPRLRPLSPQNGHHHSSKPSLLYPLHSSVTILNLLHPHHFRAASRVAGSQESLPHGPPCPGPPPPPRFPCGGGQAGALQALARRQVCQAPGLIQPLPRKAVPLTQKDREARWPWHCREGSQVKKAHPSVSLPFGKGGGSVIVSRLSTITSSCSFV